MGSNYLNSNSTHPLNGRQPIDTVKLITFHVLLLTAGISQETNYLYGKAKFFLGKTSSKLQTNRILIWITTLENVIPRQRLHLRHQTIYQNPCTTCLGSLTGFGKKEKKLLRAELERFMETGCLTLDLIQEQEHIMYIFVVGCI